MLLVDLTIIMQNLDRAITQLDYTLYILLPDLPPGSDVRGSLEATVATLKRTQTFAEEIYRQDREAWCE